MHRIRLFAFACFLVLMQQLVVAQSTPSETLEEKPMFVPTNVIKTNPLATVISQIPITGELRLMYEKAFNNHSATMVGLSYVYPNFLIADSLKALSDSLGLHINMFGFRIQAAQKIYISGGGTAPRGFYIGPHASFYTARLYVRELKEYYINIIFANASLIWGYQFILGGRLAIDIYTGIGYRNNFISSKEGVGNPAQTTSLHTSAPYRSHLKYSFSVNIGLLF